MEAAWPAPISPGILAGRKGILRARISDPTLHERSDPRSQIVGATELARAVIRMARVDSEARECLGAVIAWIGVEELSSSDNKDFTLGVLPAFAVLLGPDMYGTVQVRARPRHSRGRQVTSAWRLSSLRTVRFAMCLQCTAAEGFRIVTEGWVAAWYDCLVSAGWRVYVKRGRRLT